MISEKKIFKMGADAYMAGKTLDDNPFDQLSHPEEHNAWQNAFIDEAKYWAREAALNVRVN